MQIKAKIRPWQITVTVFVCALLALNAATHTLHTYHWFTLLAIPAAFLSGERGRCFFFDWLPLFLFWVGYDRLRLLQWFLLGRVAVEWPYALEKTMFGWISGGSIPPHSARQWLAARSGTLMGSTLKWSAQIVYLSQIFTVPSLMLCWWILGWSRQSFRQRFVRHLYAFTALNAMGLITYLLVPVAPPWWVTIWGMVQPSAELVSKTQVSGGMDGKLIQETIKTAPDWFAAIPSLHGAYPVLLLLLARRNGNLSTQAAIWIYIATMWISCVVLNQHYLIDLIAGALAALAAWQVGDWLYARKYSP
ncbi:MAG TPA: phosphatase PAP2 family protein [Acidobacteriota bacterium]|jgi:membrane-associated phospholipid phosphatase